MKKAIRSQSGFSMVEAMAAAAILGIAFIAFLNLSGLISNSVKDAEEAQQEPRLISSMITRAMENIDNFPGKVTTANNGLLNAALFDDPKVAETLCFTSSGLEMPLDSNLCRFKLSLYRVQMRDATFDSNGDIGVLPFERVFFRITDTQKSPKEAKYFSKMVTKLMVN